MMLAAIRSVFVGSLALAVGCGGDTSPAPRSEWSPVVVIDWNESRQPISGFGASSAWTAPSLPEALADQLFSAEHGIGLSFLRLRITPNGTSDELDTAHQALARGVRVWAAPWTPPGAWKTGTREQNALWGGRLLPEYYPQWADRLAGFVEAAAAEGVPLFGLSVQNEPGYVNNWETCQWTPDELATFTRDHLLPALEARGLSTPLIAPESENWNRLASYAEPLLEDPAIRDAVGFVATHSYAGTPFKLRVAADHGKELWQTEVSEHESDGPDPGIDSGLWVARMMHDALTVAEVSAWHYWWLLPRTDVVHTDNPALVMDGALARRGYVMGNYSKFVRPGSVRLATSSSNPQPRVFVTAFRDDSAAKLVIVAINFDTLPIRQQFELAGASVGEIVPWVTSDAFALEPQPPIAAGSELSYELPARSVTSLVAPILP